MGVICRGLAVGLAGMISASCALADTMETDWMELVKGYKGEKVGAELRDIQVMDDLSGKKVTLAIPKDAIAHPDVMEEVRVVGRMPEAFEIEFPLEFTYEWVDDYDNDYYGLVIHLGKEADAMPIRLYLDSRAGFPQ